MLVTESRFVVSFLSYFGLINTNLYMRLNVCDRVREHCIPKPFVHILLRLGSSASDNNDVPRNPSCQQIQQADDHTNVTESMSGAQVGLGELGGNILIKQTFF
jgi:hypothetical protein